MKKLLILVVVLIAGAFGLSHFKNAKIASEFTKQIDTVASFEHGTVTCAGFINADCKIEKIMYQGLLLADSLTLKDIDPTVQFEAGTFINLPVNAEIENAKFSLFDISSMLQDEVQEDLKNFFTKYTMDYDINIKANFLTDGQRVRDIDIVEVDAKDKMTPFILEGKIINIDTYPILKGFQGSFDFSHKRIVFYDFIKEMRKCCLDKFPERYLKMSDEEIWNDMISQTTEVLKMNIKNQFNQDIETDLMKAMLSLLQEEKNILELDVKAKKDTPLEQTVMMFFIAGPDAVKEVYDIKVRAK
ncbi:MAG TPA: hypothetical protein EYG95_06655 [Campylobacterales bacterium]|nr:hypothetical protein [Campylobacterales bacterium]